MMDPRELPIWASMGDILAAFRKKRNIVVSAATGSGKTTQVPQALLECDDVGGAVIYVVEPRRVACRAAARRVAEERGATLGGEVGYIVRYDHSASERTKLCFVTDGVFMRLIESDPSLQNTHVVIFDEFHERRILSDLALAMARRVQNRRRSLRLIVMSATLETELVASYLDAEIVESQGRSFPVDIRYRDGRPPEHELYDVIADKVVELHLTAPRGMGDILVFLPGKREIANVQHAIEQRGISALQILPLHAEIPGELQDRVFQPIAGRKVVLATNVAETSLTIPGVSMVIDSGLERRDYYQPDIGMSSLVLQNISRASADQRAGRAGREGPGVCVRLWSEEEHTALESKTAPEIQRVDVASVVMSLKAAGIDDVSQFEFLEAPSDKQIASGERLLTTLGALDGQGQLTKLGWRMARLPLSPRLACMVVWAGRNHCLHEVVTIAALLSQKFLILYQPGRSADEQAVRLKFCVDPSSDLITLFEVARRFSEEHGGAAWCSEHLVAYESMIEAQRVYAKISVLIDRVTNGQAVWNDRPADGAAVRRCLAAGLIDRLAVKIGERRYRVADNNIDFLASETSSVRSGLIVIAKFYEGVQYRRTFRFFNLALEVSEDLLRQIAPHLFRTERCLVGYFPNTKTAQVREQEYYLRYSFGLAREFFVNIATAYRIQEEVAKRATSLGCERVEVVLSSYRPGTLCVQQDGREIPVNVVDAGSYWASSEVRGGRLAIEPQWRIFDIPKSDPEKAIVGESFADVKSLLAEIGGGDS